MKEITNSKNNIISPQTVRYIFTGTITAAIDLSVYILCFEYLPLYGTTLTVVSTINAWSFSTIFSFFSNKFYVFKGVSNRKLIYELGLFLSVRLLSLLMSVTMMILLINSVGINFFIAKITVSTLIVSFNYIVSRILIFGKEKAA